MLQQPRPGDYVVATGETNSVREFAELAFSDLGLDYKDHVTSDRSLCALVVGSWCRFLWALE